LDLRNFHLFDTQAFNSWYAQQRQAMEDSAELYSDADQGDGASSPAETHGRIRHNDFEGAMRLPPQSNLQNDEFNRARHSVDLPYTHPPGSAAEPSSSDLHDRLLSSARYTAPSEPELVAQTRKSGGLWSRVKSQLSKALGSSGRKKLSGGWASDVVYSELRMDFAKRGRGADPYPDDAAIIDDLANEELNKLEPDATSQRNTVMKMASNRRRFSAWLQREQRGSIVSRLNGTDQQQRSLNEDYSDFRRTEAKLTMGLNQLRLFLGAKSQLRKHHPYPDDARLIDDLANEELNKLEPGATSQIFSVRARASNQRRFSDWLQREQRGSIASRLTGTDLQQQSLDEDYSDFRRAEGRVPVGLERLRQLRGASKKGHPYPDDARIIESLAELSKRGKSTSQRQAVAATASNQRRFSAWLQTGQRGSIVSRVNGTDQQQRSLKADYSQFTKAEGKINVSLARLRQYQQVVEANAALGVASELAGGERRPGESSSTWSPRLPSDFEWPTPEGASARSSDIYRGLDSFVDLPSTPQQLRDDAQSAPVGRAAAGPPLFTGPSDAPARSSDIYRGLDSFVDLPSTPQQLRDDAQSAPVGRAAARPPFFTGPSDAPAQSSGIYRGLQSFVDLPSTPQQLRDDAQSAPVLGPEGFVVGASGSLVEVEEIGALVGEDWQHGSRPVPDFLLDALDNIGVLPTQFSGPRQVAIHGETYSITRPRGRRGAQFVHHPRPSPVPDARTGTSGTGASSAGRSGRMLGPTDWLGDEHVQRDYELLRQQLQESNPDLAARTQFVDSLIAQMLRSEFPEVAGQARNWIHHTADFLFLPVSDAGAAIEQRGSHWSLLLVDRRDRENRVAYHYDSLMEYDAYGRPVGHNDEFAMTLAGRLEARPQRGPMSQQMNSYDCGVFVLDGTRELVRRLAATPQPDLSLNNLIVDRQALQDRLRAGVGFN